MSKEKDQSALILSMFGDDGDIRIYRPKLNVMTGNPLASILLQQAIYWWKKSGARPFYKFNAPCGHSAYKRGDSWEEELGFTTAQLRTARGCIAFRMKSGRSFDGVTMPVVYWTDSSRRTWYNIIQKNMLHWLSVSYADEGIESNLNTNGVARFDELFNDSLNSESLNSKSSFSNYLNGESLNTYTKTTSKTTNKDNIYNGGAEFQPQTETADMQIVPIEAQEAVIDIRTALTAVSSTFYGLGVNESEYMVAAHALNDKGVSASDVSKFGAWWNGGGSWYTNDGRPQLKHILSSWDNFTNGIAQSNGSGSNGKTNGRYPKKSPQSSPKFAPVVAPQGVHTI